MIQWIWKPKVKKITTHQDATKNKNKTSRTYVKTFIWLQIVSKRMTNIESVNTEKYITAMSILYIIIMIPNQS